MLRIFLCGAATVIFSVSQAFAFGLTADQMYRNLVVSERAGTRTSMAHISSEPLLTFKKTESRPEAIWQENNGSFAKKKKSERDSFEKEYSWNDIVVSVKKGQVSPFELAEIRRLSERDNAEAVELLAWMYATGTGLRQDLQKSYAYYLQAANMGVPSAYDNVRAVYQAMTPDQRAQLPAF